MLESVVRDALNTYVRELWSSIGARSHLGSHLGEFIEGIKADQLDVGVFKGKLRQLVASRAHWPRV